MGRGKRVGERAKRSFRPALLALALACTLCVVAWGYLVYAAIDFGRTARGGDGASWLFLALASVGAVACLFLGLILLGRMGRTLGLTNSPPTDPAPSSTQPTRGPEAPRGGHRAAR